MGEGKRGEGMMGHSSFVCFILIERLEPGLGFLMWSSGGGFEAEINDRGIGGRDEKEDRYGGVGVS